MDLKLFNALYFMLKLFIQIILGVLESDKVLGYLLRFCSELATYHYRVMKIFNFILA
jgi:hypothetical protein